MPKRFEHFIRCEVEPRKNRLEIDAASASLDSHSTIACGSPGDYSGASFTGSSPPTSSSAVLSLDGS